MPIDEVFPNPTVKQVVFQIRFPTMFYLESKMGEYQTKIMGAFPESRLGVRRSIVIADLVPGATIEAPAEASASLAAGTIWSFKSREGVVLNVHADSLDISSDVHKTYNNPDGEHRFRDVIELAVGTFLAVTNIPMIKRIGLRYVDECPVPARENAAYEQWYATTFPLGRFGLPDAIEMMFQARVKRGEYFLIFKERLKVTDGAPTLTLDFDGYAEEIEADTYLSVSDALHDLILKEYELSLNAPVYAYMKRPKE